MDQHKDKTINLDRGLEKLKGGQVLRGELLITLKAHSYVLVFLGNAHHRLIFDDGKEYDFGGYGLEILT